MDLDRSLRYAAFIISAVVFSSASAQTNVSKDRPQPTASISRSKLATAEAALKADRPYGELQRLYAKAVPKQTEPMTPEALDALLGLARVEFVLGHRGKTEALFARASQSLSRTSDPERYARIVLGRSDLIAGAEGEAMALEALSIAEETSDDRLRVKALTRQALAYLDIGSHGQTIIVADQAIQLARSKSFIDLLPAAILVRAKAECNINKDAECRADTEEVLSLVAARPDSNIRADAVKIIARSEATAYAGEGCGSKSIGIFRDALRIARDHDIALRIPSTEIDLSQCLRGEEAVDMAMDAWLDGYMTDLPLLPRLTNRNLGSVIATQDRPVASTLFFKRAVNALAVTRLAALSLPRNIRGDRWNQAGNYYDLVDSLVLQNRFSESQRAMELMASDELLGIGPGESVSSTAYFEVPFTQAERAQSAQLDAILVKYATVTSTAAGSSGLAKARAQAKLAIRHIIEQGLTPATPIAFTASDEALLKRVQSYLAELHEPTALISLRIDFTTAIVQVTTKDDAYAVKQDWTQADRRNAAADFFTKVVDPHADPKHGAQTFYDMLIAPVRQRLDAAGIKNLLFFPGLSLAQLPAAAMFDGQHWLAEDFGVATYVPLTTERLPPSQAQWRVAAFGVDSSLPAVTREINAVVKRTADVGDHGILAGEVKMDSAFTADSLHAALDDRYPVIHIASHFLFDPNDDDHTYLVLGNNGKLKLTDLQKPAFDFSHVDLLTLSACDTGSVALSRYSNFVHGLGYVALDLGARSVLGTLWPVLDDSTADFMQDFYAVSQTQKGDRKIAALRAAQLAFIHAGPSEQYVQDAVRGLRPNGMRIESAPLERRDYSHPYYWAGFSLMGDPR